MLNPDREIDKTSLSLDLAEERLFVHRDYIAHCLRWSHIIRHISTRYKTSRVFDIGCGKETPLVRMLYSSRMIPESYTGVEVNKIKLTQTHLNISRRTKLSILDQVDFSNMDVEEYVFINKHPTLITCLEVLEHMIPEKVDRVIQNIYKLSDENTDIFISSPCFNGKSAKNHINEMTYEFLKEKLSLNFNIVNVWGTFASQSDIKPELQELGLMDLFETLRSYYDNNYLATIFAPLLPHRSRNCMWYIKKGESHEA